jgi:hypothetical protein
MLPVAKRIAAGFKNMLYYTFRRQWFHIKKRTEKAYWEGYHYHQREVRNDPQLFNWVVKNNYLDYRLPE